MRFRRVRENRTDAVLKRESWWWGFPPSSLAVGCWCHEESSRRLRLMRSRRGDVDGDEEFDDDVDDDGREASWFLYQRILSAEMRMKSFLGWSAALWRLEGRGEVTRAIVGVKWVVLVVVCCFWSSGMVILLVPSGSGEGWLRNLLFGFWVLALLGCLVVVSQGTRPGCCLQIGRRAEDCLT